MKTFRFLGIAIAALFMTVNFTSCNNEGITPEDQEEKYIEVDLGCTGEILDIENSPLAKTTTTTNEVYNIAVFSLGETIMADGYVHYLETPYATGTFTGSLQGVVIRLLEGKNYRFKVSINLYNDGKDYGTNSREFNYNASSYISNPTVDHYNEGYYGELDKYTPVEGGSVLINTKRVSYGVKFVAEGLTEGTLNVIAVPNSSPACSYSVQLTTDNKTVEKIYSFPNTLEAWRGRWVSVEGGTGAGTYVNYYEDYDLTITWTKADGSVVPLGTFSVTFERNVKTTVKIKAEEAGSSNGITVVKENVPMVDDDKEYQISGGTVTEVPVNNA